MLISQLKLDNLLLRKTDGNNPTLPIMIRYDRLGTEYGIVHAVNVSYIPGGTPGGFSMSISDLETKYYQFELGLIAYCATGYAPFCSVPKDNDYIIYKRGYYKVNILDHSPKNIYIWEMILFLLKIKKSLINIVN